MFEKLLKKYLYFFRKNTVKPVIVSTDLDMDIRQREMEIFGEDRVNYQRLYEKWVVKESWQLYEEAIPLLLGIDPDNPERFKNDENNNSVSINELGDHARQCIQQGLLTVINKDSPEKKWRVKPVDVYKWAAVSRVEIPEQLSILMNFIQKTICEKKPETVLQKTGIEPLVEHYANDKEKILGTALAILVADPDKCRNENGVVSAEKIVNIINEKGEFWFGDDAPGLSSTAMVDLINKWTGTVY